MYIIGVCALMACTKPPKPSGPAFEKVNGQPTAIADVGRDRSEGKAWDDVVYSPKMPIVYFELNSDEILSGYIEDLSHAVMMSNADWVCQVDGHASEDGSTEYNLALSERRAARVAAYLATFRGITTKITSYGEEQPAATRALSRRVEVRCN